MLARARAICCLCWRNLPTAKQRQICLRLFMSPLTSLSWRISLIAFLFCLPIAFTVCCQPAILLFTAANSSRGRGEAFTGVCRVSTQTGERHCECEESARQRERVVGRANARVARPHYFYKLPACRIYLYFIIMTEPKIKNIYYILVYFYLIIFSTVGQRGVCVINVLAYRALAVLGNLLFCAT